VLGSVLIVESEQSSIPGSLWTHRRRRRPYGRWGRGDRTWTRRDHWRPMSPLTQPVARIQFRQESHCTSPKLHLVSIRSADGVDIQFTRVY
jgi:hypothetical protein